MALKEMMLIAVTHVQVGTWANDPKIPANGDFRFGLTLNRFDNVAPFADNAPNEIVGGEHLQGDIVRTRETCFLLHYLENATTRL